jgi:hypothetical protein
MAPSTPPHAARKRRVASPGSDNTPQISRGTTISDPSLRDTCTGHSDRASPDRYGRGETTQDRKDASLLGLPCELLEMVASNLLRNKHIVNLALTNRHLHGIIRKTMVRQLVVSKKHVKSCVDMLARHPDLITCVTCITLGDFGCEHEDYRCLGTSDFEPDVMELINTTITSNTISTITWDRIQRGKDVPGPVWHMQEAFFLEILTTLCPNLKSVTVELPAARQFSSGGPPQPVHMAPDNLPGLNQELTPVTPFQGSALQVMRQKLEALTIAEDTRWKGPPTLEFLERQDIPWRNMGKHTITLTGFSKLRRLDVPMEVLGHPCTLLFVDPTATAISTTDLAAAGINTTRTHPRTKVLPLTLRYLHLRSCNKMTFALLQKINEVPVAQLRLKHIELFSKTGLRDLVMQCDATDLGRFNYLQVLSDLNRKGTKVTFYTWHGEEALDIFQELASLSALSPFEVWRSSASHISSPTLNPAASEKRRIGDIGIRIFLRHAEHHMNLFNRATLDLRLWTHAAFFHGIKNTKWDLELLDRSKQLQPADPGDWEERPLGKREARWRLPVLLSKIREERVLLSN